jgi:predicted anti-sigma-YlaC factor YlaD
MDLSCDIVLDLVALYHDKLASENSVQAINTHLKQCPSCRKAYNQYKLAEIKPTEPEIMTPEDELRMEFQEIAKRMRNRRYLLTSGAGFYVILSLAVLALFLWRQYHDQDE